MVGQVEIIQLVADCASKACFFLDVAVLMVGRPEDSLKAPFGEYNIFIPIQAGLYGAGPLTGLKPSDGTLSTRSEYGEDCLVNLSSRSF